VRYLSSTAFFVVSPVSSHGGLWRRAAVDCCPQIPQHRGSRILHYNLCCPSYYTAARIIILPQARLLHKGPEAVYHNLRCPILLHRGSKVLHHQGTWVRHHHVFCINLLHWDFQELLCCSNYTETSVCYITTYASSNYYIEAPKYYIVKVEYYITTYAAPVYYTEGPKYSPSFYKCSWV
jgi:hypothetical protein